MSTKFSIFSKAFSGVEGGSISHDERSVKNLMAPEYTYGEIDFLHFLPLLNPTKGGVFWDLGCGTAKTMVAAALSQAGFTKICGVEYLHGLCVCAEKAITKYRKIAKEAGADKSRRNKALFRLVEGDITKVDWSNADVVYASSLCFPEELMKKIAEQGKKLKKGTVIISIKKWELPEEYKTLGWISLKMGWGKKSVYLMEKL